MTGGKSIDDCVPQSEVADMMKEIKAMFKEQSESIRSYSKIVASTRAGYILSCLPSYDGFGSAEYISWEITMDKIFAQHCMCDRRKIKNAASSLTSRALIWWKDLCDYYEDPQIWKDMRRCL